MALPYGIKSTQELLDAQAHVWNHIFNFINSMSLKCAVQLGIPDIIHKHRKPITISELINSLQINKAKSHCVERLMRILVHSKFFIKDEKDGYWLTPASRLLLRDEPFSLKPFVLLMLDPILTDPWHNGSKWFQNGDSTPFLTTYGRPFWEQAGQDPRLNQLFNDGVENDAGVVTSIIMKDCRHVFEGLGSMVDVGGGKGTLAKAITRELPSLKCSVLDLPHVVAGLQGTANLTFVAGDMFESIPPADSVFMKWIMHDWPDEECISTLEKCKEAIPTKDKGGKVIIVDVVLDIQKDYKAVETQLFLDLLMMFVSSGRERAEKDWEKLFFAAGFTGYKIWPVLGHRSLIEVFP